MDWISLDDELPKTGNPVLVRLEDGRELESCRVHTELFFKHIESASTDSSHWDLQLQATHWMPLPKPPETHVNPTT